MKTLDDVIKAWEICDETVTANCPNCPYDIDCENVPGEDLRADTLDHLKEYRRDQNTPSRNGHMALVDYFEQLQKNELLTWDELKAMEGKPIWVEVDYHNPEETYKHWTIVKYFDSDEGGDMVFTGTGFYHKDLLGIDWRAYRKEKNETD